jgi:hypothetical protein
MPDKILSLTFNNTANRKLNAHPITYGVPLIKGRLRSKASVAIRASGKIIPVQSRVLEQHEDGSVRWLLLDFSLPLDANFKGEVDVVEKKVKPRTAMKVVETKERVTVTTPHLCVAISKKQFSVFESYRTAGKAGVDFVAPGSDATIELPNGKRFAASRARRLAVSVIEQGPERVVVESAGRHTATDGGELFDFRMRYTFRPDEPGVRVSYKFTNVEAPERGLTVSSISLAIPTVLSTGSTKHLRQTNSTPQWFPRKISVKDDVEVIASKSVNDAAKARYGNAADGKVVIRNLDTLKEDMSQYPYFLRPGNARTDMTGGLRSVFPYLAMADEHAAIVGWFFEMGQNYPKGVRSDGTGMHLDIWPQWAGELLWRRGMSKEHDFYVACFAGKTTFDQLEAVYLDREMNFGGAWGAASQPVTVTLDPDYVRETRVHQLHHWLPYDENKYPLVELKMGTLGISGSPGQFGMMDYGDYISPDRSWAHNNEDDAILNNIRQYFRMRNPAALMGALASARHNSTIDFIAHDPDPLRQGTMPAHCPEHTDGSTYPSHMWCGGLLAAYCLTGSDDLRNAATSVGENMRRWQVRRPEIFYADSRECGWPMLAYVQLWHHTHDKKWLKYSREVFDYYEDATNADGVILYDLPHGMGFSRQGYGEFIAWRAVYFYHEVTQEKDVKKFLVRVLEKAYKRSFDGLGRGGWACNDLFPAWAAHQLTGDEKYITDNHLFFEVLMKRQGNFPWGGNDVMFYLNELHRRGELERFQR